MEYTDEIIKQIRKEAWQEGYDAALQKIRMVTKLAEMGIPDCQIVNRVDLPPVIVHAILGGEHERV